MEFGSLDYTKFDYTNTLAATLGYFLYQQGDAVGLLSFSDEINDYLPARNRTGHLRRIMLSLEQPPKGKSTDPTLGCICIISLQPIQGGSCIRELTFTA